MDENRQDREFKKFVLKNGFGLLWFAVVIVDLAFTAMWLDSLFPARYTEGGWSLAFIGMPGIGASWLSTSFALFFFFGLHYLIHEFGDTIRSYRLKALLEPTFWITGLSALLFISLDQFTDMSAIEVNFSALRNSSTDQMKAAFTIVFLALLSEFGSNKGFPILWRPLKGSYERARKHWAEMQRSVPEEQHKQKENRKQKHIHQPKREHGGHTRHPEPSMAVHQTTHQPNATVVERDFFARAASQDRVIDRIEFPTRNGYVEAQVDPELGITNKMVRDLADLAERNGYKFGWRDLQKVNGLTQATWQEIINAFSDAGVVEQVDGRGTKGVTQLGKFILSQLSNSKVAA